MCLSPADGQPQRQLGLFYTEEAAASAYDQLALELWGPSTPTNFGSSGAYSCFFMTAGLEMHSCVRLTHCLGRCCSPRFCVGAGWLSGETML